MISIPAQRLYNQQISHHQWTTPAELVHWMGAIQAQHYGMAKWAIGCRLPKATHKSIELAIEKGEIIRTHLLRSTWHFVAAQDLRWMLELTAPRIKVAIRSRHKQLGITDKAIAKSNESIQQALSDGKYLLRKELIAELKKAGFQNDDNLGSHLLLRAELDGIICSGPTRGKSHTYALLDDRVPKTQEISRDEALAKLARLYFRSHGPATIDDFHWWSGLTKTTARKALEMIVPDFISEEIHSKTYWLPDESAKVTKTLRISEPQKGGSSVHLLPAYDEFLISYKNRSAVISDELHGKAVSNNGIFWPIIVINGRVAGTWKRTVNKKSVRITIQPFDKLNKEHQHKLDTAAATYGKFLDKKATLEIA